MDDVLRNWWLMFQNTDAGLQTVSGDTVIDMVTGIRQGSVESPLMFAAAIDWILCDLRQKHGLQPQDGVLKGLDLAEIAFVDDMIVWDGSKKGMSAKASLLVQELPEWGLSVNIDKCQAYVSQYNREEGSIKVDGRVIQEDTHLDVMGLQFKVGITAKEALAPLFAKVKSRFWALKHLFRAKTPLAGRLALMNRTLGNKAMWCIAAFQPDKQALQVINVLQSQLTIWSMRLAKRADEDWLDYRVRSFRSARWSIQRFMSKRWSTCWLERAWDYAGHRARCVNWDPQPPSSLFTEFRTLHEMVGNGTGYAKRATASTPIFPETNGGGEGLGRSGWWIVEGSCPGQGGVEQAQSAVGGGPGFALGLSRAIGNRGVSDSGESGDVTWSN